jgi:hypothetical protein
MNRLFAFNWNGSLVSNYPFEQESTFVTTELAGNWIISFDTYFQYASSPVLADIDNDGTLEAIIGSPQYGVLGFDSRTGASEDWSPLLTTSAVSAVPLVADIDGNGTLELAVGSDSGLFYVWDMSGRASDVPWGCIYHDGCHSGLVGDAELPPLAPPPDSAVTSFYVYPNPAAEQAWVRYRLGPVSGTVRVLILDMAGEPVATEVEGPSVPATDNELLLDARRLASGMYVVRLCVERDGARAVRFTKLAVVR